MSMVGSGGTDRVLSQWCCGEVDCCAVIQPLHSLLVRSRAASLPVKGGLEVLRM